MTNAQDIQLKQLEMEKEKIRIERDKNIHYFKMQELELKKEIAEIYRVKRNKNKSKEVKHK